METVDEKTQAFTHRLVEFANYDKCIKYFTERQIDFDQPNSMGWSVLMSVCACGRDDLVGFVVDRTAAVDCATNTNRTTVLHLTAMSKNTRVMEELVATAERKKKLQKILDQPNAHGDTALMMACVAKNVSAVQLLLELGASMNAVNVSGLNALMCAARVGEDPRSGAPTVEKMMERSAVIVKCLLLNGADVNVTEKAGDNTALHLAVLSENVDAVGSLITNAPDLDITLRNAADYTALDLSKRISGVVSAQMEDLLSLKWTQYEKEATQMSAKMEQELMDLEEKEALNVLGHKQPTMAKTAKKKSKKSKKKAKTLGNMPKESSAGNPTTTNDRNSKPTEVDEEDGKADSLSVADETKQQFTVDRSVPETSFSDDDGTWQSVIPKKTRRKESLGDYTNAAPKRNTKKPQRKPSVNNKSAIKNPQASSKPITTAKQTKQDVDVNLSKAISIPSTTNESPWAHSTKPSAAISPRSQVTSEEEEDQTTTTSIPYEMLNGSFHRTFPVAAELEIDVDKFLIASSVSDRELEPNDSLSISQVEALQEAHWQAYHYLNEKKIELSRVLEAQRVEAQFALQQELMQIK